MQYWVNLKMSDKKIYYKEGFKYQLARGFIHQLRYNPNVEIKTDFITIDLNGVMSLANYYAWDGPSGPTYDSKNSMRGSLVHDPLYQLMRMGLLPLSYRHFVDDEMYLILREDGMSWIRAKCWHWGLTYKAESAALPKNKKKILEAP